MAAQREGTRSSAWVTANTIRAGCGTASKAGARFGPGAKCLISRRHNPVSPSLAANSLPWSLPFQQFGVEDAKSVSDITQVLQAVAQSDPKAAEELLPLVLSDDCVHAEIGEKGLEV